MLKHNWDIPSKYKDLVKAKEIKYFINNEAGCFRIVNYLTKDLKIQWWDGIKYTASFYKVNAPETIIRTQNKKWRIIWTDGEIPMEIRNKIDNALEYYKDHLEAVNKLADKAAKTCRTELRNNAKYDLATDAIKEVSNE